MNQDQVGQPRSETLRLDNTKRSCAAECLRKYYWQHELHLKPKVGSTALRYGIVWHAAMDAFYSHIAENGWDRSGKPLELAVLTARVEWNEYSKNQTFYDDYRSLQNLLQSLVTYIDHFAHDEGLLNIVASEQLFEIPMEPESEKEALVAGLENGWEDPFFTFTGMIDLEIELSGNYWIIDHKTTGKQIAQMQAQLRRSPQFIGYSYAATKLLPTLPMGFLVVIHHLSAYKSRTTGEYGKAKIDFDRTPELYTPQDISQWRLGIFDIARQIYRCKRTGVWPMKHDSCHTFGRCTYNDLCDRASFISPDKVTFDDQFFIDDPWDIVAETTKRNARREAMLRGEVSI